MAVKYDMKPYPIQDNASFEALLGTVKAGFPSPADDFREKLDLVKLLVRHSGMDFDALAKRISRAGN